jgi:hypothetical protein
MYAIIFDDGVKKDILPGSISERSDETLNRLAAVAAEYKAMFPECNYYIVKIDMEII